MKFPEMVYDRAVVGVPVRSPKFSRRMESKPAGGMTQHDYAIS